MSNKLIFNVLTILIWGIALFGLSGTFGLAREEFIKGNICPKIIGIPACYIILACLLLVVTSQSNFLKDANRLYFIGAGIAAAIALSGTVGQLMGWLECPKTSGGTPMCFLSLALFGSLLILKILSLRLAS